MAEIIELDELSARVSRESSIEGLRKMARRVGISHATLSRVQRGFPPDAANYIKLCKLFAGRPRFRVKAKRSDG